jgi:hypothetical protein
VQVVESLASAPSRIGSRGSNVPAERDMIRASRLRRFLNYTGSLKGFGRENAPAAPQSSSSSSGARPGPSRPTQELAQQDSSPTVALYNDRNLALTGM